MEILFVCKSLPGKVIGGIQTHTWELSGHLARRGHEVSILIAGSAKRGTRIREVEGRHLIEVAYFPGRKLPIMGILAEEMAFNFAANRWLRKYASQYDIVHLQGRSGMFFPQANNKVPIVATFHGLISVENSFSGQRPSRFSPSWWHEKWAARGERNALQYSDTCLAVSQEMKRMLELHYPQVRSDVQLVSNGVNIPQASPDQPETDPGLLLFVGRLHRVKGIYTLLEAMKNLSPSIRLTIIGDGPERERIQTAIQSAGLTSRVQMLGAKPAAEVSKWLFQSFALAVPSTYETQGIVVLEANAHGKPVIASANSGLAEVVRPGENGLLVPTGDAEALARAIDYCYNNPDISRKMGEKGIARMYERYTWEAIAMQTERHYGTTLAKWEEKQRAQKSLWPLNSFLIS